jgi:integrase
MSITKLEEGVYAIRWWERGRHRNRVIRGSRQLAEKIERKALSLRDENRYLEIKRDVNFRMAALVKRYREVYGNKKKSREREKSILDGIEKQFGRWFVREFGGAEIQGWYDRLVAVKGLSEGTALRHFNVMHHMMGKAATIWAKETGIDRNPADLVEVVRPDDQRERYLAAAEMRRLKQCLDAKLYRRGTRAINRTFHRLRLLVLIALATGMRMAEIFALERSDVRYDEELIAVRAKLKRGKVRYVPLAPELAEELRRCPAVPGEDRIFPPRCGAKGERQRVERSFAALLELAGIADFRFHDLRHTFASWYMMNGGDLYELAKILGHANIKMTERYAKLARKHIARTGNTAREIWKLLEDKAVPRPE